MSLYSEFQIRQLHSEYRSLKKYVDRLSFFDKQFGIIPFPFPDFDPELGILFQKEKTADLTLIFRNERNNPSLTEKKFSFTEDFVFNIRPANSNSSVYSNYILSIFLNREPDFELWIRRKIIEGRSVELLLEDANEKVNHIENCLENEYDKSFRLQCMSVFYKGFFVAFSNQIHAPGKKRKFIELYLFAQGMIYAKYIRSLKNILLKSRTPVELQNADGLDLPAKLQLMQEMGMIDLLRTRYAGMDPASFENKISEIICLVTGEPADQKETVIKILEYLCPQRTDEPVKYQPAEQRKKILRLTTEK
jgi:hypothetical protein